MTEAKAAKAGALREKTDTQINREERVREFDNDLDRDIDDGMDRGRER